MPAAQANLPASAFKERALPIHINITHTPPVLADDGSITLASTDPGFIGGATLLPGTFATGSYGWKGNKRFTVEIDNPDGEGKEKVHVMLTYVQTASIEAVGVHTNTVFLWPSLNATVIGSKGAKEADDADEGGEPGEANGETKEAMEEAVQDDDS